jgi:hypothetical protein
VVNCPGLHRAGWSTEDFAFDNGAGGACLAFWGSSPELDSEVNDFKYALRTKRPGAVALLIENAADSVIGPGMAIT